MAYESQINGINTAVAEAEAQLAQAQYYLEHTAIDAPADGYITNLQVQPGMVSGILRVGGIASFIVDERRYMLATFPQEQLRFVQPGQPVEIALDLHPGRIFEGEVESIWWRAARASCCRAVPCRPLSIPSRRRAFRSRSRWTMPILCGYRSVPTAPPPSTPGPAVSPTFGGSHLSLAQLAPAAAVLRRQGRRVGSSRVMVQFLPRSDSKADRTTVWAASLLLVLRTRNAAPAGPG